MVFGKAAGAVQAKLHELYASINTKPGRGLNFAVVLWDKDRLGELPYFAQLSILQTILACIS